MIDDVDPRGEIYLYKEGAAGDTKEELTRPSD